MISLRPAGTEDIPFIMGVERLPGYEDRVGRWSEAEHTAALASPDHAYFIGENDAGCPVGFAMIQDRLEPHGNLHLRRIAVRQEGQGFGRRLLFDVIGWAFQATETHRFWLEVLQTNTRAQHLYRSSGFQQEGIAREGYRLRDGSRCDFYTMSILRREWEGLTASGSIPGSV